MGSFNIFHIYELLYDFLARIFSVDYGLTTDSATHWIIENLPLFQGIGFFIAFAAVAGIIYAFVGINRVRSMEAEELGKIPGGQDEGNSVSNERWLSVTNHLVTENPNDWRYALLEADIMLGDLLTELQYHGDTIGEQLKQIEESDFLTLDKAWEAHKIRNMIAHSGSDFILTKREARRIVALYEDVFREFHFI
jgi:hypothetical protein